MLDKVRQKLRGRNILLLLPLLLINPLFFAFNEITGGMMPDSPAYILFGNQLIQQGSLFLAGWGHVDSGLILPPFYPALIGLFNLFNDNGIYNAQLISTLALLLTTIPLYLLVRRLSHPVVAVASVLIFQLNLHSQFFGTMALAEALFILVLLNLLNLNHYFLKEEAMPPRLALLIGLLTALLFFSRHIGIFYLAVFPLMLFPQLRRQSTQAWRGLVLFIAGFLLLFAPYTALLYSQSGQGPFTQHFRMNHYVIEAKQPQDTNGGEAKDYLSLYKQRREQRRLLPDASEMLGNLVIPTSASHDFSIPSPSQLFRHARDNFSHAKNTLGSSITFLFLLASLSGLYAARKRNEWHRALIPLTVISYFFTLSLVVGLIERYLSVMFPLLATQILIEGYLLAKSTLPPRPSLPQLTTPLVALSLLALTPQLFTKAKASPRFGEKQTPISHCKPLIKPGAPIFSLNPMEAYLLGGVYRILPNDNLQKIANYAQRTGVQWLLLRQSALNSDESEYLSHASWLRMGQSPATLSPHYKMLCKSLHGDAQLYAIISSQDG